MIEIKQYGEKSIEITEKGKTKIYDAVFRSRSKDDLVYLSSDCDYYNYDRYFKFDEMTIEGETPTSAQDAYDKLKIFIGLGFNKGGGGVSSVNGQTGDVVLDADDISGVVKLESNNTQIVNSDIALQKNKKLLGVKPDGTQHVLIESAVYNEGTPQEAIQVEVGNITEHLNKNTNNDPIYGIHTTTDTPNGKEIDAYLSDLVNADWNATSGLAQILNKPTNLWDSNNLPYEEGEWTPVVYINNSTNGITYSNQHGRYTIIGNHITCFCTITLTSKGSNTGAVEIRGFPLPIGVDYGVPSFRVTNTNISGQLTGYNNYTNPSNQIILEQIINGTAIRITDVELNNNSLISFTLTYFI